MELLKETKFEMPRLLCNFFQESAAIGHRDKLGFEQLSNVRVFLMTTVESCMREPDWTCHLHGKQYACTGFHPWFGEAGRQSSSRYETTSEHHQELVPGCLDHTVVSKDKNLHQGTKKCVLSPKVDKHGLGRVAIAVLLTFPVLRPRPGWKVHHCAARNMKFKVPASLSLWPGVQMEEYSPHWTMILH